MWNFLKKLFSMFIPTHIEDPGLAIRMIRSGNPAAYFTLFTTGLGVIMTPFDILLERAEKRLYAQETAPQKPIIFVCGAPRTGTTLMEQFLIKNLDVAYFNNLTSIFVRSPIKSNLLYSRIFGTHKKVSYNSYYSKTTYFTGPNDAFYLWNRWMTEDETGMQCVLTGDNVDDMVKFFAAYETAFNKPIVSKNNSLNTRAEEVAKVLPTAYFICMTREDVYLAQGLLQARMEIQGNIKTRYGVDNPHKDEIADQNYIVDVCDQVKYHERKIAEQQKIIGEDRFWIIPYEEFCKDPRALLERVSTDILKQPVDEDILSDIEPFKTSNRVKLTPEIFQKLKETLTTTSVAEKE